MDSRFAAVCATLQLKPIFSMRRSHAPDLRPCLLPAGRRWGFGAHSVLPYLNASLQARPGEPAAEGEVIRNPVFPQMENALRALRRRR
jgi:hypothetical protein